MKLAATRQSWLVTVPIALGASAYVWFVFLPGKRAIADLNAELQAKQMYSANAAKTLAAIRQLEELTQDTQAYAAENRLPSSSSSDMARLYGHIAEAMQQAGVRTTRFAPESPIKYDQMQRTPIKLGGVGTFVQVTSLLASLERLPHRLWITSMSVQPDGEDGDSKNGDTVRCEVTLDMFVDNPDSSN